MADTQHLCERCKELSLNFEVIRSGGVDSAPLPPTTHGPSTEPWPLGRPQDWDATCSLCRSFAKSAAIDLTARDIDTVYPEEYDLRQIDTVTALTYAFTVIGPKGNFPVSLIVMRSPEDFPPPMRHRLQLMIPTASEEHLHVRPRGSVADVSLLGGWIANCVSDHEECRLATPIAFAGMKLVDCFTGGLIAHQPDIPYLALSYVWSEVDSSASAPNDERAAMQTPLIQSVFRLTLKLGYKFIWIDRFCIDQTDQTHKLEQIRRMDEIYGGATLTIVAADHVHGPRLGLSGDSARPPLPMHTIGAATYSVVPPAPWDSIRKSKWNSRAWTYQESVLSRRRLVVLPDEIYFDCSRLSHSEVLHGDLRELEGKRDPDLVHVAGFHGFERRRNCVDHVYAHVWVYARREMTLPTDVLNAFEGVLRRLRRVYSHLRFLSGLPIEAELPNTVDGLLSPMEEAFTFFCDVPVSNFGDRVIIALCWQEFGAQPRRRPHFPSWTWAGWYSSVPRAHMLIRPPQRVCTVDLRVEDFLLDGHVVHLRRQMIHINCPVIRTEDLGSKEQRLEHCDTAGTFSLESHGSVQKSGNHRLIRSDYETQRMLGAALYFLVLYYDVHSDRIEMTGLQAIEVSSGRFERLDCAMIRINDPRPDVVEAMTVDREVELV